MNHIIYYVPILIGYTRQYYIFYVTVNYVKRNLAFYNVIDQNTYNRYYVIIVKKKCEPDRCTLYV